MFDSIFNDAKDLFKENKKKVSIVNKTKSYLIYEQQLPDEQSVMKRKVLIASQKQLTTFDALRGDTEPCVKIWLLNDGTPIHVDKSHAELCDKLGIALNDLFISGAIRIDVTENGILFLQYQKQPTNEQIQFLVSLVDLHNIKELVKEDFMDSASFKIRSSYDLKKILKGGEFKRPSLAAQFHESIQEDKDRDPGKSGFVFPDGRISENSPYEEHAEYTGQDDRFSDQKALEYRIYPGWVYGHGRASIVIRTRGILTSEQIKVVNKLMKEWYEPITEMLVEDLRTHQDPISIDDPINQDWARQVKRLWNIQTRPSLAAQFHESVDEANLSQLKKKQQSITRLFPDFYSNPKKVPGVAAKGGIRLHNMEKDKWEFRIHSATEDDLWYDAVIKWKNVGPNLERLVADRRNWNKKLNKVDLKKLAAKMFSKGDVELSCSCPSQLYYGMDFILSQDKYRAKYGEPENRSPDIRNPKKYGAYCKHLQNLMKVLPFYKGTMANWIKKFYNDVIEKAERKARETAAKFKAAGIALGKKKVESIQESAELPEMQQQLKDMFPPATQQQLMTKSTFPHEEVVKLWILNDGTMLWAEYAHFEMLFKIKVFGYDQAKATGMIRVSSDIDNGELHLDFKKKPTQQQILALQEIAKLHDSTSLWIDEEGDSIPLRSPSDLSAYFRGEKVRAPSLAAQFHESLQEELSYKEQLADAIMRGRVWRVLRDDFSINVELEHMKVIGSYYKKERAKDIDILVTLTSEDFKKLIGKIAYFGDFAGYLIDVFITDGKHNGVGVQINKMGHVKFKQLKKGTYNEFL